MPREATLGTMGAFERKGLLHVQAKLKLIGAVIALVVGALAFVGCNMGGDTARFAGTWNLQYGESSENAESLSEKNVASMRALGIEPYLNLDENGNLALVTFEKAQYGTWEMKGRETAEAVVEGQDAEIVLDGDLLRLKQEGTTLVFSKGDPKSSAPSAQVADDGKDASGESASAEADASAGSRESAESDVRSTSSGTDADDESDSASGNAETRDTDGLCDMIVRGSLLDNPVVMADDSVCTIVVDGVGVDKFGDPGYNLQIENNADHSIDVWVLDPFIVDGVEVKAYLYETIDAGQRLTSFIQFDAGDVKTTHPSGLVNVSGTLMVDGDADATIAKYPFTM